MSDPEQNFTIAVELEAQLTVEEIWPDGDAPENPTAEDVAKAMRKYGPKHRTLSDWGLLEVDVQVWDDRGGKPVVVWYGGSPS